MSGAIALGGALGRASFSAGAETLVHALLKVTPARRDLSARSLNLVVLVDRSAAMDAERGLEWAQRALGLVVERLGPADHLAIVAFAERVKVVLPAEPMQDSAKARRMISFIDSHALGAGASLAEGLKAAGDELRKHAAPGRVNRIVILTAGLVRPEADAEQRVRQLCAEGAAVSVVGVGQQWAAGWLTRLADACFGSIRYAPRPADLPAALREEVEALQRLPFMGLKLRLRLTKGVAVRRVFQVFPSIAHWLAQQPTERDVVVSLGDLAADQPSYVLVELVVSPRGPGAFRLAQAELAYEVALPAPVVARSEPVDLVGTVAEQPGPVNREVARFAEEVQIYALVERGIEARRGGDAARAGQLLGNALKIARQGTHGGLEEALEEAVATLQSTGTLPEHLSKRVFFLARQPELQA